MHFGLHVSIAGSIANAPFNAFEKGAECFQIFSRSPQGGPAPKLSKEIVAEFQAKQTEYHLLESAIHTPYYINLASLNEKIRISSIRIIREELERATLLGVQHVMTHLGSAKDQDAHAATRAVAEGLKKILKGYTGSAALLLENSAGAGKVVGDTFEEISFLLKGLPKTTGVCLDTCHVFTSGYDLRTAGAVNKTLKTFDDTIGIKRLQLIHANDSMADIGEHKDRHEHIGKGKIGLEGFRALVRHPLLQKVNMILETRHDGQELVDISTLKKLRDAK